jgi:hypothetical protein
MSQQLAEPLLAKTLHHEALEYIHVGIAVALDENRPVLEDGDVPADDDTIGELAMRLNGKLLYLSPQWQSPALNRRSAVGVPDEPA